MGASARYVSSDGGGTATTVYVYDRGQVRRPDGGDNPDVAAELRAAAAEVGAMVRAGRYWSATPEGGMSVGPAPGPVEARCANFRAVQQDGRPTGESACVTVQGGSFIEVRATT